MTLDATTDLVPDGLDEPATNAASDRAGYLNSVMNLRQRLVWDLFILTWVLSVGWFFWWWYQPAHWTTATALVANSAVITLLIVQPGYFFFFVRRMRRPNPRRSVPALRVALVVTKAPSEPWEVLEATLRAMLDQDLPYPYDTWLADEDPSPEVMAWCLDHGVMVSTRRGVREYQRPDWPRRARCKEGNLAFFYDHFGYERYDVVAQLDADHVPSPSYLRQMVVPFADPSVGYVAAPSICDRNAASSWAARGRLYAESAFHGPIQAGHAGGFSPSCIGSHYAVRTAALKEVGGLGPELAEDFSTTLMLSSAGWEGVFAMDAEAHGYGPDTVADAATQEFQWARSMMVLLLQIGPRYWRPLRWRQKLRLGFCLIWYPLLALQMTTAVLLPVWALVFGTGLVRVPLVDFFLFSSVPFMIVVAASFWLRRHGWLRPRDTKILSWEAPLFQLVKWPWVLAGCLQALAGLVLRKQFTFRVTPKAVNGPVRLPFKAVVPYLSVATVSVLAIATVRDPGTAQGYYLIALLGAVLYMIVAGALICLHVRETDTRHRRTVLVGAWVSIALLALIVPMIGWSTDSRRSQIRMALAAAYSPKPRDLFAPPSPVGDTPSAPVALGVTTPALAKNWALPWVPANLSEVDAFERDIGKRVRVIQWYSDWAHSRADLSQLRAVVKHGSIPEITWEPWNAGKGPDQPNYSLSRIISGHFDAYIRSWAVGLKRLGHPVRLRFAQEMNASWYPWDEGVNGNTPGQFARAWQHVHDIFDVVGATNVKWVWAPVTGRIAAGLYPGNRYVDVVGLSGYNFSGSNGAPAPSFRGYRTFQQIFGGFLPVLEQLAPTKPVEISEVASAESPNVPDESKAAWITDMFAQLRLYPEIKAVIWFNVTKEADWPIQSSPAAIHAFARAVAGPRYG